jgi:hypothetical protein
MEVVDDLAALAADVEDQLISRKAFFVGDLFCGKNHLGNHSGMVAIQMVDGLDMLLGNYEDMDRRGRVDVLESHNFGVFIDYFRRGRLICDFAENAVFHLNLLYHKKIPSDADRRGECFLFRINISSGKLLYDF